MDLIRREVRQPIEFTTSIARRFEELITFKAEADMDALVEQNPSFDEFGQELRRFSAILENINYNSVKVIRLGMFEVHRRPTRVISDNNATNEPYCRSEYTARCDAFNCVLFKLDYFVD